MLGVQWRRKWQPTPVFLPGESQGQRSLVGCRLWGCTESDMTEVMQQGFNKSELVNSCKTVTMVATVAVTILKNTSTVLQVIVVQFCSVAQSCPTLCDPMNHSTPGLLVRHQLPESTQTHVHCVGDAIQPFHPLLSPSPPALNLSQHQGLFK